MKMEDLITPEQKLKLLVKDRPWENEPNEAEWVCETTGYHCRVRRHPNLLHLNGYVGIHKGHPCHGMSYEDLNDLVDVHGGLTYSGKEADLMWFGFDTGHAGDLSPGVALHLLEIEPNRSWRFFEHEEYRDWEFVKGETEDLALQLYRVGMELWNGYTKTGD